MRPSQACGDKGGVRRFGGGARTHTLVMGYASRVVRFIDSVHLEDDGARVTIRV